MADVLILAIETASGCGGVALTRGTTDAGKVLAEYTLQPETTHARQLLGSVGALLAATNIGWSQLDGVAVSQGPGSFTGLRIGLAAAQGIALAADLPLVMVPTLDGLAAQVPPVDLSLCCLLDARKQQVYAALYGHDGARWQRTSSHLVVGPEELLHHIHEPTLLVGPGLNVAPSLFATHSLVRMAPRGMFHPRASAIGLCAARLVMDGTGQESRTPVPLYVRASEAELNMTRMGARCGA